MASRSKELDLRTPIDECFFEEIVSENLEELLIGVPSAPGNWYYNALTGFIWQGLAPPLAESLRIFQVSPSRTIGP